MKWNFPTQQKAMQDVHVDMKIGAMQINRHAKNSEKESEKYMKDAKNQLRNQNQESAKMYLQNAAYKKNEATNLQKMGVRNQMLMGQVKSMQNNQKIMNSVEKMGYLAKQMNPQFEKMAYTMNQMEENQTKMSINQKMMDEIMNQQSMSTDPMADGMLNALKQQLAMEEKIKLDEATQLQQRQRKIQELKKRNNNLQF